MKNTKIIHTGDTHLGYSQYHKDERQKDFLDAFNQVVDHAVKEDVDAVIHGGDLFHRSRPEFDAVVGALTALNKLSNNGIPFFSVLGNHDGGKGSQWVDVFERAERATHLGFDPTMLNDSVALYGLDYIPKTKRKYTTYGFTPTEEETTNILVAHGSFSEIAYGKWRLTDVFEDSRVEFDYVLLGDEHNFKREDVNNIPIMYSGSTERTAVDQIEERTFTQINLGKNEFDYNRIPLNTREFVWETIDSTEETTTEDIRNEIDKMDVNFRGSVVIINIEGISSSLRISNIEKYVKNEYAPFHVKVNDKTEKNTNNRDVSLESTYRDIPTAIKNEMNSRDFSESIIGLNDLVTGEMAKTNLKDESEKRFAEILEEETQQD